MKKHTIPLALAFLISIFSVYSRASDHEPAVDSVSPKQAYHQIVDGNKRFMTDQPKHEGQGEQSRKDLASGQKPHTIVLSCSDSRVPPELIFDQGLGQLFTVRVAGNVLDPATVASIEYAVEHLGSKLIVVMGHESCGAVKAAINTPVGQSAGSKDLDTLVAAIRPNLNGEHRSPAGEEKMLRGPVKSNVEAVTQDLMVRSKIVRTHVQNDGLVIIPAIYSLESGFVSFWNNEKVK
jgi:carbonic anhydrase